jgi:hypothetical protein
MDANWGVLIFSCLRLRPFATIVVALGFCDVSLADGPQSKSNNRPVKNYSSEELQSQDPIGEYLLKSGMLGDTQNPQEKVRIPNGCPEPKYCSMSKAQRSALLRGLDKLGREKSDLVNQQMVKFCIRKPNYDLILRDVISVKDKDSQLTTAQYVDALGISLENGRIKISELMNDLKLNASDLYEALDAEYDSGLRRGGNR